MSGEMVPPQYSPSNAARSFTIRGRAKCPRRRARSFDEGVIVSRPSAAGRDVIVTLYTESNFSFRLLVCGSSIDTQLCCLHEAFLFRANLLACLSLAKHKSDRAARRWASRHKNIRRRFAVGIFSVLAVLSTLFRDEFAQRACKVQYPILCHSYYQAQNQTAPRVGGQADIKISDGKMPSEFFIGARSRDERILRRGESSTAQVNTLCGLSKRRDDAPA